MYIFWQVNLDNVDTENVKKETQGWQVRGGWGGGEVGPPLLGTCHSLAKFHLVTETI